MPELKFYPVSVAMWDAAVKAYLDGTLEHDPDYTCDHHGMNTEKAINAASITGMAKDTNVAITMVTVKNRGVIISFSVKMNKSSEVVLGGNFGAKWKDSYLS